MTQGLDPELAAEIARTLRDEIGARELYTRIARAERDTELARLLQSFAAEGLGIERTVRDLLRELGARGRERSLLRRASARIWGVSVRFGLRRLVLRLCLESEEVIARRYALYAQALAAAGRLAAARECDGLATRKARRAGALRAWVPH